MVTVIALVLQIFIGLISSPVNEPIVIPPMPHYAPSVIPSVMDDEDGYWCNEYDKAESEFTALFNEIETKWSKNNRLMVRRGNSGSYKFVAKKG